MVKDKKNVIEKIEEAIKEGAEKTEEVIEKVGEEIEDTFEKITGEKKKTTKNSEEKKLAKEAEAESTKTESLEEKKKALLEKAKELKEKLEGSEVKSEDLKELVKAKKHSDMLIPLEDYVKSGIYLGTRVVTPNMKPFVYRRRADGLAIFNTDLIDEKLKEGIAYMTKFAPEEIILVCKRQAGWKAAEALSKITGIKVFTKKYPAGILTNTQLRDFSENELTIVTDHWLDKNALMDTLTTKKKVLMVCDTNNFSHGADQIIIGNNKSPRSLGLIFYLITREYCKARGIQAEIPDLDWWTGEDESQ